MACGWRDKVGFQKLTVGWGVVNNMNLELDRPEPEIKASLPLINCVFLFLGMLINLSASFSSPAACGLKTPPLQDSCGDEMRYLNLAILGAETILNPSGHYLHCMVSPPGVIQKQYVTGHTILGLWAVKCRCWKPSLKEWKTSTACGFSEATVTTFR